MADPSTPNRTNERRVVLWKPLPTESASPTPASSRTNAASPTSNGSRTNEVRDMVRATPNPTTPIRGRTNEIRDVVLATPNPTTPSSSRAAPATPGSGRTNISPGLTLNFGGRTIKARHNAKMAFYSIMLGIPPSDFDRTNFPPGVPVPSLPRTTECYNLDNVIIVRTDLPQTQEFLEALVVNMSDKAILQLYDYPARNNLPIILRTNPAEPVDTGFAIIKGALKAHQIWAQRPSYIKALLIMSRGFPARTAVSLYNSFLELFTDSYEREACEQCRKYMAFQGKGWPTFLGCVRMPEYFGAACARCIFQDKSVNCSSYDGVHHQEMPLYNPDSYEQWVVEKTTMTFVQGQVPASTALVPSASTLDMVLW
jgi:hypothetical protein